MWRRCYGSICPEAGANGSVSGPNHGPQATQSKVAQSVALPGPFNNGPKPVKQNPKAHSAPWFFGVQVLTFVQKRMVARNMGTRMASKTPVWVLLKSACGWTALERFFCWLYL